MSDAALPVHDRRRAVPPVTARSAALPRSDGIRAVATWLLFAVALDLVVTRLVVRLAIFVPKGEPWSTWSAWLGRIGAVADVLVLVFGIGAVVALLVRAGHGTASDRWLAGATTVVATAGLALLAMPPAPVAVVVVDVLIASIAIVAVVSWRPPPTVPRLAYAASIALGLAVAAPAVARLLTDDPLLPPGLASPLAPIGLWVGVAGEWAFVLGAAALGVAGLRAGAGARQQRSTVALVGGVVVALMLLSAAWASPVHLDQLVIWSVGLTGAVPAVGLALAAGLAIAGFPGLVRRTWPIAVGGAIVVCAGYGLAASGLILASLIGLQIIRVERTL